MVGPGSNCTPQDNEGVDCNTTTTVEAHPNIHAEKTVNDVHTNSANPGDLITYEITAKNTGDADGTAAISDDVTAIEAHATISDISDGGVLSNHVITWS